MKLPSFMAVKNRQKAGKEIQKILFAFFMICLFGLFFTAVKTSAKELFVTPESTDESNCENILDDDEDTTESFERGTRIRLKAKKKIASIYIRFETPPGKWTLLDGKKKRHVGRKGFLHAYIPVSGKSKSVTIIVPKGGMEIADVFVFSEGELPEFVQKWKLPREKTDVLYLGLPSDTEDTPIAEMLLPYIKDKTVLLQTAFFDYDKDSGRNHELLNQLWEAGIRRYPQFGSFRNPSANKEKALTYVKDTIDRFAPQAVICYDDPYIVDLAGETLKNKETVLLDRFDPSFDLRKEMYTYAQREERAAMKEQRAQQENMIPQEDAETDPKAVHSLEVLLYILAAVVICLILFYILTEIRKKTYKRTLEK